MGKFKVSDKAVALTSALSQRYQQRKKGNVYKVCAIRYCPVDGHQSINIGQATAHTRFECNCGNYHPTNGLRWTDVRHFEKPISLPRTAAIDELLSIPLTEERVDIVPNPQPINIK